MPEPNHSDRESDTLCKTSFSEEEITPASATAEKFETACRELKKARRKRTILCLVLFFIALVISMRVGEFSLANLVEGLPGLLNYAKDTVPELHWESMGSDVRQWYWGIDKWIQLHYIDSSHRVRDCRSGRRIRPGYNQKHWHLSNDRSAGDRNRENLSEV